MRHAIALCLVTLSLAACDRDDDPSSTDEDFDAVSKTESVGPAGGTIELVDPASAISYSLSIPAGALPRGFELRLRTQRPAPGERFRLLLEPPVAFRDGLSATLRIGLPQPPRADEVVVFDQAFARPRLDPEGRVLVDIPFFPIPARLAKDDAPLPTDDPLVADIDSQSSASFGCTPDPQTAPGAAPDEAVTLSVTGGTQAFVDCMDRKLMELEAQPSFSAAVAAARMITATVAELDLQGQGEAALAALRTRICNNYKSAVMAADAVQPQQCASFIEKLNVTFFWGRLDYNLGSFCAPPPYDQYYVDRLLQAKTYWLGKETALAEQNPSFDCAAAQLKKLNSSKTGVRTLEQATPAPSTKAATTDVVPKLEENATALVDPLIPLPWQRCRDDDSYQRLGVLATAVDGSFPAIARAAQYCGTRLSGDVRDFAGQPQSTFETIGGIAPRQELREATVPVRRGDQLRVTGPINALDCPDGTADAQTLEVRLDGELVDTFATDPWLQNPLTWQVNSLLAAANLSGVSEEDLTQYPLTFTRTGGSCDGAWGGNDTLLLTLTLDFQTGCQPPAGADFCIVPIEDLAGEPVAGRPVAINDEGTVLLNLLGQGPGLWKAGVVTTLPQPDSFIENSAIEVKDFNNQDEVVGTHFVGNTADREGLVWRGGSVSVLPGTERTSAEAINDDGIIVGSDEIIDSTGFRFPFAVAWTANDVRVVLKAEESFAFGINDDGLVVGQAYNGSSFDFAKWQLTDGQVSGGPAAPITSGDGFLSGVDDAGNTVGRDGRGMVAFGPGNSLLSLPSGYRLRSRAPSATGFVLLGEASGDGTALYDLDGGTATVIDSDAVDPALGWNLDTIFVEERPLDRYGRLAGAAQRNGDVSTLVPFVLVPRGAPLPPLP